MTKRTSDEMEFRADFKRMFMEWAYKQETFVDIARELDVDHYAVRRWMDGSSVPNAYNWMRIMRLMGYDLVKTRESVILKRHRKRKEE